MLKKITLTLGVLSPLITVISCSSNESYFISKYIINDSNYINNNTIKLLDRKLNSIKDNSFDSLKAIHIIDHSHHKVVEEALFLKETNEIFFNTKRLRGLNFKSDESKAEYMYEIIYHEYIHFLNERYLNNIPSASKEYDDSIHSGKTRSVQIWNKSFINNFKQILKYNLDTKLYGDSLIRGKYVSLGSVYNQKDLFDISNDKAVPKYTKLKGDEVMSPTDPDIEINDSRIISADSLEYLFSMEELVARKMQVISMKYHSNILGGEGFDSKGMMIVGKKKLPSPYLEDFLNFSKGLDMHSQYLNDVPTKSLSDLYDKYVHGIYELTNISFKNNKTLNIYTGKVEGNIDKEKISYEGITNKIKDLGYIADKKFVQVAATWRKIHIKDKEYFSYKTSYINPMKIINNVLAFRNYKNEIIPIKTYRDGIYTKPTTYKVWDLDNINFSIKYSNGKLMIIKV